MRKQEFNSKLISLLPLDEVPVHVHRFAARAPCDSQGSQCQCGIHTAEAASALRSRKTERAAKEKPTPISQFFLAPAPPATPPRPHALGRLPPAPPLRPPPPLRFPRPPLPGWNPYSRGRLGPAKSKDRKGGEGKTAANLPIFLAPAAPGTPTRRHALGRLPTPPPLPENLLSDCTENCPLRPASTQEVSESENRPATRGTAHSEVQGDDRGTA